MNIVTFDTLSDKLKLLPNTALERVNEYVDALIEPSHFNKKPYNLSVEQQKILDSQLNLDKSLYVSAEEIYEKLKSKL